MPSFLTEAAVHDLDSGNGIGVEHPETV